MIDTEMVGKGENEGKKGSKWRWDVTYECGIVNGSEVAYLSHATGTSREQILH